MEMYLSLINPLLLTIIKLSVFGRKANHAFPISFTKNGEKLFSAGSYSGFLYMNNYTTIVLESDFKEYVLRELKKHSNFHLLGEGILDISGSKKKGVLVTKDSKNLLQVQFFRV